MSTPGPGGPQPPEQDPSQPGPPAGWGQLPPAGQPGQGWGAPQQPQPGQGWGAPQQPQPGQGWGAPQQPQPGQQPPDPQQNWTAPQQPGQPWGAPPPQGAFGAPQPGGAQAFGQPHKPKRKLVPIIGGLVALIVVLGLLTTFLGGGDPEVGDCLKAEGTTEFSTVDCDSADAEYRVEGTDEDMTYQEMADAVDEDSACPDVTNWTVALWVGDDETEDGHVYCVTDV